MLRFLFLLLIPTIAYSHSGGTNEYGCHAGSQPYHCHNDEERADLYQITKAITLVSLAVNALDDFNNPTMLYFSGDSGNLGLGVMFKSRSLYMTSKFNGEESHFNVGVVVPQSLYLDFMIGIGAHGNRDYEHVNPELNLNVGMSYELDEFGLVSDIDSADKSISLGVFNRF